MIERVSRVFRFPREARTKQGADFTAETPRKAQSPSFARIDRLKPAPPSRIDRLKPAPPSRIDRLKPVPPGGEVSVSAFGCNDKSVKWKIGELTTCRVTDRKS